MSLSVLMLVALQLTATESESTAPAPAPSSVSPAGVADPSPTVPADAASRIITNLEEVRRHFKALTCDRVIALAPSVEDHRLATLEQRQEAAFSRAYCLVVLGNLSDASKVFDDIVVEDLAATPPFEVEPRVMVLLEAARAKEKAAREATRQAERAALLSQIALVVTPPGPVVGGNRAFFGVKLVDSPGLVRSIRLEFRRPGEPDFSALPVSPQKDGSYRGEIPGTFTRSRMGITLEWFIRAVDVDGEVVAAHGSRERPHTLTVAPGSALALDLKANERLPQDVRIGLAVFGTPTAAATLGIVGVVAGNIAAAIFAAVPFLPQVALVFFPTLGATLGAWMVASIILDGSDAAITAGTAGGLALGTTIILVVIGSTVVRDAVGGDAVDFAALAALAGLTGLSALTVAAVATTLVVLDEGE